MLNKRFDFQCVKSVKTGACLIRDFLSIYNMQHNLSVFVVEIGLNELEYYSENELSGIASNGKFNFIQNPYLNCQLKQTLLQ